MQKAMIFAAGLGTRLMPLTAHKPKALVELNGITLLQRAVDKLTHAGIRFIVINIHHFPDLMKEAIEQLKTDGAEIIISDESDILLDTGGGLTKAAEFLKGDKPFVLHNVDVISDVNLKEMYSLHIREKALATLAVSKRLTARYFMWDNGRLCGWTNTQTKARIDCGHPINSPRLLAFSGIHIVSPEILDLINETGIFSINKVYLRLAEKHKIIAYEHDPAFWADLGTVSKLEKASKLLNLHPEKFNN
jgi:NDP-sugar pyrophosphorylase family protein